MNNLLLFVENDDPMAAIIFVGIAVVVVTVITVISRRYERRRAESFVEMVEDLGLEFSQEDEGGPGSRLGLFQVGNVGRGRKMKNVVSGVWSGEDLVFCDYKYVTGHGKRSRRHSQSLVILTLNGDCPNLLMMPEGIFSKVVQAFGAADINFPSNPEFSKRFVLRGDDEDAIRERFNSDVLEFFEGCPGVSLEVRDGELVFYRHNRRCKPEELEAFFEEAAEVKAALEGEPQS